MALEEIFNPKMKQTGAAHKLFKSLNNTYIQEVFDSMNEDNTVIQEEVIPNE